MNLTIFSFADAGNIQKERIVLVAKEDLEVGEFAVFISRTSEEGLASSDGQQAFWFPDGKVRANDLVVIYTKGGADSTKLLSSNRTAHFFYWDLDAPVWAGNKNTAVVIHIDKWAHRNPVDTLADDESP
jgi:hypothetical protein